MKPRLRIFVSSPSDVSPAREIAALTIERLAQDYSRFFAIEPYLWEFEAMVASGHFQDSIEPPSAFDVVVLIVWSRLGTNLPERTTVREYRGIDGRTPVTGTEWEFEEAFQAAQVKGAPDLLVYRCLKPASFDTQDQIRFEQQSQQLKALNLFWGRYFANQGMFIGAYTSFITDAEFAKALETHLRKLIEKRIEALPLPHAGVARAWAHEPFRGLETYEFEHAPIFFGQDEAIAKAMIQLTSAADEGTPFLLVLGASGSGKSSLVKAGVLPKLFVPRRIAGVAFLRRVVFRPSDTSDGEDLFDGFARRLTTQVNEHEGLSEVIRHGQSVQALAAFFRSASVEPSFPIGTALGELMIHARQSGQMLEYESPKMVLVIDQLEELFGNELIRPADRNRFVQLLFSLVRSGWVWVVATMRKDFWHRADETPELVQLAEGPRRLEMLPPGLSQFTQMIRRPVEATGISFEFNATTNVPLNEVIADEVAREPNALPLLSYLLDQIYRSDVPQSHGHTLTYATYERLGRLDGAIATKAEAILKRCQPDDRLALGSVLFVLVDVGNALADVNWTVARRVPLSTFSAGTAQRRLVEAFLDRDARLLVSDAESSGNPTIRVAHEALISRWTRAREFVQRNAEFLRIRRRIEERHARWLLLQRPVQGSTDSSGHALTIRSVRNWFRSEQGLLSDIDVMDGRRLLKEHATETESQLTAYIYRSIAHEERIRRRTTRALTAITSVVALLAAIAVQQRNIAQVESSISKRTTKFMVDMFEIADPDKSRGATITVREMLDEGAKTIRFEPDLGREPRVRAELLTAMGQAYSGLGLYKQAEDVLSQAQLDERLGSVPDESRVRTLLTFGSTLYLAGDYPNAEQPLRAAVTISRKGLASSDNLHSRALTTLADDLVQLGKYAEAEGLCNEALAADRKRGPDGTETLSNTLASLGSALFYEKKLMQAEAPMREALDLRKQVYGTRHALTAVSMNDLGVLLYETGRYDEAMLEYRQALAIDREVFGENHPEVSTTLSNIGRAALMAGHVDEAEPVLRQALAMTARFDGDSHNYLVSPLNSLAMIDAYRGHLSEALGEIKRAEAISRLPDYDELLDQVLLNEADIEMAAGSVAAARNLLDESLRHLEDTHPKDAANAWRYAIWDAVNAEWLAENGDFANAERTLNGARTVIESRFGTNGFYSTLVARRAALIANASKRVPR